MRRGGTARSIRIITAWLILISLIIVWGKLVEKKQNYTELWKKVNQLEVIHGL